jgi:hypothetical protein
MIETLPLLAPDSSRGARTMARCHRRLAAQRRRSEARHRPARPRGAVVERLLLAALCVVYLVSMAGNVLALIGPR